MSFGFQLLAWRRRKGLTQQGLAVKTGVSRPYLSRLERDEVDPSLSLLRRLAAALGIAPGALIDSSPSPKHLSRHDLDRLARGALKPGGRDYRDLPLIATLARAFLEKRAAFGLTRGRAGRSAKGVAGVHALRRLRAELGDDQWHALIQRVNKHAPFAAKI